MKLLITTQAVDKNDPILGFFHGWLTEFSKHFEHIHVICLREGKHTLPPNVSVYSLGKEHTENKFSYVWKFYAHVRKIRSEYDAVFVHMNPHYILLYGLMWRIFGKDIYFWRNHARMNVMTRLAAPFARRVFYTSPFACTARYVHGVQMPVGIDTNVFALNKESRTRTKKILFLGRISPVKKIEILVASAQFLPEECEVHIYGDAPAKDRSYLENLKATAGKNVFFHSSVKNDETPTVYHDHDIFINLTPKGSMDKTVLEAASCGLSVLVANESFLSILSPDSYLEEPTAEVLAQKIIANVNLPEGIHTERIREARERIIMHHSLAKLGETLYTYIHDKR